MDFLGSNKLRTKSQGSEVESCVFPDYSEAQMLKVSWTAINLKKLVHAFSFESLFPQAEFRVHL